MAEVTAMRNNALPYPIYGQPFTIIFPFLDADGDLVTGATTPDAEVSKNGDTFADCTNESTEVATSSGMYYLTLTATEMTADVVAVIAKSATSGMKTTPIVLYPRKLVTLRSGTAASGGVATSSVVLDSGASAIDDYYNGCVVAVNIDGTTQVRMITDYVGSSKTATVHADFTTAPDSDDTFTIYMPDGVQVKQSDGVGWLGTPNETPDTAGVPVVNANYANGSAGTIDRLEDFFTAFIRNTAGNTFADSSHMTDAARTESTTDHFKGSMLMLTSGTYIGLARRITAFDPATDTLTFEPFPGTPSAGDDYLIVPNISADVAMWLGTAVSAATAGIPSVNAAYINNSLSAAQRFQNYLQGVAGGTSDSGTTTTMVDAARTEADSDYFVGSFIHFTSGTINGQCRRIIDFNPATDTITFDPPTTQAVSTQTYVILPFGRVDIDAVKGSTNSAFNLQQYYDVMQQVDGGSTNSTWSTTTCSNAELTGNDYVGMMLTLVSGTYAAQSRLITGFDAGTDTITFWPALPGSPGSTDDFTISPWIPVNVAQIRSDETAADNLVRGARASVPGNAITGTLSTTQMTTDLTEATDDHYNGRSIVWTSGVLAGQASDITDYDGATKMLTYSTVTDSPSNGDDFIIV